MITTGMSSKTDSRKFGVMEQLMRRLRSWLPGGLPAGALRIHFLEAGVAPIPAKSRIRAQITRGYRYAQQQLPAGALGAVDVVVQVQPAMTLPEIGIGGYSPAAHLAFLFVDPASARFQSLWAQHLGAMLVHELMHCARWTRPGYGPTLGEALVSEGLALHFEAQFRGQAPWYAKSLDEAALAQAETEARANWHRTDYDRMAWFSPFGAAGPYGGYSLGYALVARRIARSGPSAPSQRSAQPARNCIDLYDAPASDF